jgi:hypothetical protein
MLSDLPQILVLSSIHPSSHRRPSGGSVTHTHFTCSEAYRQPPNHLYPLSLLSHDATSYNIVRHAPYAHLPKSLPSFLLLLATNCWQSFNRIRERESKRRACGVRRGLGHPRSCSDHRLRAGHRVSPFSVTRSSL